MPDQENEYNPVIPGRVRDLLLKKKQTVSVAESVTAGHLQVAFSLAENAMDFFQGGITVYNLGQKTRHLGVNPIHGIECNCVSEQIAVQMARQVNQLFLSDWGLAITGYASPVPEENITELFACYAICYKDKEMISKTVSVKKDSPEKVRLHYTKHILSGFADILAKQK